MFGFINKYRDLLRLRRAVLMADNAHLEDGERYYVMPTADGKLMVMDRRNFRIMKKKGYINSDARVNDLVSECFYCTPYRNGDGELPPDVVARKRRQYLAWAGVHRKIRRMAHGSQGRH